METIQLEGCALFKRSAWGGTCDPVDHMRHCSGSMPAPSSLQLKLAPAVIWLGSALQHSMCSASSVSRVVTALPPPSCGGPRITLWWHQIVCSTPATIRLAPAIIWQGRAMCSARGVSRTVTASPQPSFGGQHLALYWLRIVCSHHPPCAGRHLAGLCYALSQRRVTCSDRLAPAVMWLATLCALLLYAGSGSCAACLPPSALRKLSSGGAALCAQLAACHA